MSLLILTQHDVTAVKQSVNSTDAELINNLSIIYNIIVSFAYMVSSFTYLAVFILLLKLQSSEPWSDNHFIYLHFDLDLVLGFPYGTLGDEFLPPAVVTMTTLSLLVSK